MKKSLVNIIMLCISTAVVFSVSEFSLRLTKIAYEPQFDNQIKITRPSSNHIISYELIPDFKGQAYGGFVSVNSFGFRGPEVSQKKPDGVRRIAVLGDSWAFGWGVNQDEVVTTLIEKQLNNLANKERFEVLNFSLFGYNLQQEEIILKEKVLAFQPDIVIFAYNINDLEGLRFESQVISQIGNKAEQNNKTRKNNFILKELLFNTFRRVEGFGNEHSHLFRLSDNILRGVAIQFHFGKPGKSAYYKQCYEEGTQEFLFLKSSFHRIGEIASKHQFKVCIIYFPWMNELTQDNPYVETFEKVKLIAEKEGFLTLNLFPFFQGQDVNKLRISKIDGHPTALGHKIAADDITEFILLNFR